MTTDELELRGILRSELAPIHGRLDSIAVRLDGIAVKVDGLPLMSRALTVLQQDVRALRAAFNDFALTNVTKGEIEALHTEVDRVHADYQELGTRLITVERRLQEFLDKDK